LKVNIKVGDIVRTSYGSQTGRVSLTISSRSIRAEAEKMERSRDEGAVSIRS